jgi:hypothetical protein
MTRATRHSVAALLWAVGVLQVCGAAAAELSPHFEPLRPLLGKTWRGAFPASKPGETPKVDVQRWEAALNGQAVRILHSINDGDYGGESIVVWDKEKRSLIFYYFTTAGFYTTGTARVEDGALVTVESVKGNADGITEVKGVTRVLPDGRMHVKTQYLKNGQWSEGRDMHYAEEPNAEVKFK